MLMWESAGVGLIGDSYPSGVGSDNSALSAHRGLQTFGKAAKPGGLDHLQRFDRRGQQYVLLRRNRGRHLRHGEPEIEPGKVEYPGNLGLPSK